MSASHNPTNSDTNEQNKDTDKKFSISDFCDETPALMTISPVDHSELISLLIDKIEPIDFQLLAFPEITDLYAQLEELEAEQEMTDGAEDASPEVSEQIREIKARIKKMKPSKQQYIIYTIEELLKLAAQYNWGICRNNDFIYFYNGAYWNISEKDQLKSFLSKVSEKMGVPVNDARYFRFVDDLFSQFHFSANLPKPTQGKTKTLINLMNGTFEITPEDQILRAFSRGDFLKHQLPFEYDSTATAPLFKHFLDRVLPDMESQRILAEYLAYVFIHPSVLKLEKTLFLYGTGANGKSVFFEIATALLGPENISGYSLQSLTDNTGYYRANLANKLVNYASEINGNLPTSTFKLLVSGEPVEARLPYGQPFILTNYAKMIFNGNTLPKDVEHTNAYFRRFLIIPFEVTIPEAEQDKDLSKKIIASELPGIFNWMLEALSRLLKQRKFSECRKVEDTVNDYKKQSDTVALFLDDANYQKSDSLTSLKILHGEYKDFCRESGYKPVSNRNLSDRLKALGYDTVRHNIGHMVFISKMN